MIGVLLLFPLVGYAGEFPGLPSVFFNGPYFDRPSGSSLDEIIHIPVSSYPNDYSKIWRGMLQAPTTGTVTFTMRADNHARLFIDEVLVVNTSLNTTGTAVLESGREYPVRVEYVQHGGEAFLELLWSWNGADPEPIPATAFSHTEADREAVRVLAEQRFATTPYYFDWLPAADSVSFKPGPHLLVDNYYIGEREGVARFVNTPQRDAAIANPVVTGSGDDKVRTPYMTVLYDAASGLFQLWYEALADRPDYHLFTDLSYLESTDGKNFERPREKATGLPGYTYGASVIDRGASYSNPQERYILGYYHREGANGLKVAVSADGLAWNIITPEVVVHHNHDIVNLWYDEASSEFVVTYSEYTTGPTWFNLRRNTLQRRSTDLINWGPAYQVLAPDPWFDEGDTQFYAMGGYVNRGDLRIGMVKILRDDLFADHPPEPPEAYGVGYTALAWSRDGETWYRDRTPFFERDVTPGAWDHAFAWIDDQVIVDDEVYLYYGGYKSGHKSESNGGRQIGLVTLEKDRYVGWVANDTGVITTPVGVWEGDGLTVNADIRGSLTVEVLHESGNPLSGFSANEAQVLTGDHINAPVQWSGASMAQLVGTRVKLRFTLVDATLYAFSVSGVLPSDITGFVYQDLNTETCCSGIKDASDPGLAGKTVYLSTRDGASIIRTTVTDLQGFYAFHDLDPGEYRITHHVPTGYVRTTDDSMPFTLTSDLRHDFGIAVANP